MRSDVLERHFEKYKGDRAEIESNYSEDSRQEDFSHLDPPPEPLTKVMGKQIERVRKRVGYNP